MKLCEAQCLGHSTVLDNGLSQSCTILRAPLSCSFGASATSDMKNGTAVSALLSKGLRCCRSLDLGSHRMIECTGLEGTPRDHSVQTPCSKLRCLPTTWGCLVFCPMVSTHFNCEVTHKDQETELADCSCECSCTGQQRCCLQVKLKCCMAYAEIQSLG